MTFSISFPPPDKMLNENDRLHWRPRARIVSAWKHIAYMVAVDSLNRHIITRYQPFSTVGVSLPVRSLKIRRDAHNFTPTSKAIIDGLVLARVFYDDDVKHLATDEPTFHLASDNPNVVVTIQQTGDPS